MIAKVKFQCDKCEIAQVIDGPAAIAAMQRALHDECGWTVVIDRDGTRHYCPACKAEVTL